MCAMGAFDARGGVGRLRISEPSPGVEDAVKTLVKTKQGQETLGGSSGSFAASVAIFMACQYGRPGDFGPLDKSIGSMLEHLLLGRLKTASKSHAVAYSPVTGRRTMAHKTGSPGFSGPLSFVSDATPLEEYYKQEAEDRIMGLYIAMEAWADVIELIPPSLPFSTTPSGTSEANAVILPNPTTDSSSVAESYASTTWSATSSLLPGIGYLSSKALQWIGEGSLDTVAHAIIWKRTKHHMSRLKRWQRLRCNKLDHSTRKKLFDMLYDALEMSHPGYSFRVNNYATSIGVELQAWLLSCVDTSVIDQDTHLIARIHICICST
ncbi:hypothetical protein JB92DRAFT_886416 [Gautieria morchelliformis]|nr:hypothetical protein JB92DRAFT_886416 [Gautieria morchelliformis]